MSAAPISHTLPTTPGLDIPGAFPSTPFQLVESNPLTHRENAAANAGEAGAITTQVQAASTAPAAAAAKPEAPVQEKLVTTPKAVPREHKVDANGRRIRSSYFPYRQYPPSPPTPVPAPDSNARANGKMRKAPPATDDANGTAPVQKQSLLQRIRTRLEGGRKVALETSGGLCAGGDDSAADPGWDTAGHAHTRAPALEDVAWCSAHGCICMDLDSDSYSDFTMRTDYTDITYSRHMYPTLFGASHIPKFVFKLRRGIEVPGGIKPLALSNTTTQKIMFCGPTESAALRVSLEVLKFWSDLCPNLDKDRPTEHYRLSLHLLGGGGGGARAIICVSIRPIWTTEAAATFHQWADIKSLYIATSMSSFCAVPVSNGLQTHTATSHASPDWAINSGLHTRQRPLSSHWAPNTSSSFPCGRRLYFPHNLSHPPLDHQHYGISTTIIHRCVVTSLGQYSGVTFAVMPVFRGSINEDPSSCSLGQCACATYAGCPNILYMAGCSGHLGLLSIHTNFKFSTRPEEAQSQVIQKKEKMTCTRVGHIWVACGSPELIRGSPGKIPPDPARSKLKNLNCPGSARICLGYAGTCRILGGQFETDHGIRDIDWESRLKLVYTKKERLGWTARQRSRTSGTDPMSPEKSQPRVGGVLWRCVLACIGRVAGAAAVRTNTTRHWMFKTGADRRIDVCDGLILTFNRSIDAAQNPYAGILQLKTREHARKTWEKNNGSPGEPDGV
ncbi:hypothetical protein B0H19DRAFT_1085494 [Mycena capillaripes]|nr:hypothetical protein B0H19DRAFT_1085494 [Mycena capillaripes]